MRQKHHLLGLVAVLALLTGMAKGRNVVEDHVIVHEKLPDFDDSYHDEIDFDDVPKSGVSNISTTRDSLNMTKHRGFLHGFGESQSNICMVIHHSPLHR